MLHKSSTLQDVQGSYDWFQEMRNTQPVWLDESSGCWHVFRYEDVNNVITDYTLYSSERRQREFARSRAATDAASAQNGHERRAGRSIIALELTQHRQYRTLVSASVSTRPVSGPSSDCGSIPI